jgi:acetyltransferase-like isoleucine patch superfamily enzyme
MMYQDTSGIGEHVDISEHVSYNNVKTGKNGKIRHFSILFGTKEKPLTIGDDFFIGVQCYLNGAAGIQIGDRVTIAHGAMIFSDSGPNTSPWLQKHYPIHGAPIIIGDDVWIGAKAMILPGVTIGNKCVIGAGSLVKENVPDGSVVAGNPAKIIKKLTA